MQRKITAVSQGAKWIFTITFQCLVVSTHAVLSCGLDFSAVLILASCAVVTMQIPSPAWHMSKMHMKKCCYCARLVLYTVEMFGCMKSKSISFFLFLTEGIKLPVQKAQGNIPCRTERCADGSVQHCGDITTSNICKLHTWSMMLKTGEPLQFAKTSMFYFVHWGHVTLFILFVSRQQLKL